MNVGARLMASHIIKLMARTLTYSMASRLTGIPTSSMVRYVKGKTFPRSEETIVRIKKVYDQYGRQLLLDKFLDRLQTLGENYAQDFELTKFIAWDLAEWLLGRRCHGILSLDQFIVPVASIVAYFYDLRHAMATSLPNGGDILIVYGDPPTTLFIPTQGLKRGATITVAATKTRESLFQELVAKLAEKNIHVENIYAVYGRHGVVVRNPVRKMLVNYRHLIKETRA